MVNERPEALRLAKIFEDHYFYSDTNEAAAELRRLHAESEKLKSLCRRSLQALWEDDFPSLRDELRKALGDIND